MSSKKRTAESQPLIELAEGAEADDRASLFAAWKRLNDNPARGRVTNLHVRELLFYVFATNTHGRGVKLTYDEIAVRLECKRPLARSIVDRACNEYGLLAVQEERYVDGGQTANRYLINWPMVRTVNRGDFERRNQQPPNRGPGALTAHPHALTAHPYKETPVLLPVSSQYSPPPLSGEKSRTWEEVVSALVGFRMSRGGATEAVDAAKGRSLTPDDAWELVERWQRLRARQPRDVTIGWLYRWLVGKSYPPPEPWETTHGDDNPAPPPRRVTTSDSVQVELIRGEVIKRGRKARATNEQMTAALQARLQQAGYPADAIDIDGSHNVFNGGRIVFSVPTA